MVPVEIVFRERDRDFGGSHVRQERPGGARENDGQLHSSRGGYEQEDTHLDSEGKLDYNKISLFL